MATTSRPVVARAMRTATEVIADRVYFGEKKEQKPAEPTAADFADPLDDDGFIPF